ncbi:uncharacterized protein LOC114749112 [Neltuma alba]|uniref:uncharacterized protein LOC114749112 n=1 Tax=Neltuma alba TaxID=207710 RepID=UPI0010A4BEB4|nr:uncharacterized protein LOC114749112 [Prosopis alba]
MRILLCGFTVLPPDYVCSSRQHILQLPGTNQQTSGFRQSQQQQQQPQPPSQHFGPPPGTRISILRQAFLWNTTTTSTNSKMQGKHHLLAFLKSLNLPSNLSNYGITATNHSYLLVFQGLDVYNVC